MFENIIAQAAADQLKADILSHRLAHSMLFFGPAASGKGSVAIELARALSCENEAAPWKCGCPACVRHRALVHPDLVILGPKGFAADIAASRAAFLRDPAAPAGRSLFSRSLRKLLARFSPTVWEYESKSGKGSPLLLLQSLEEEIDEFETLAATFTASSEAKDVSAFEKLTNSLLKNAVKLEDEYMSETIPIAQIRRAAYWSRLSPSGKRKTLIIENADRMKDEARNSLLKLLEEPPESLNIVLTALRRESLLATIFSRLRPYRFLARGAGEEREIIRRVFRDTRFAPEEAGKDSDAASGLVAAYLDSFLPVSPEKLLPLAAFFVVAVARAAAVSAKSRGFMQGDISPTLKALGSYCAPIAEAAGFERSGGAQEVIAALLSRSGNFEGRSFPRFLALAFDLVSWSMNQYITNPSRIECGDIWRKRLGEAQTAYGVWNQRPELALESLFHNLKEDMAA